MAQYESEFTKFMREWMAAHPAEAKEQTAGRALWWDKPSRSLESEAETAAAKVPVKSYYYDLN
ncbi:MAG TPA: DUF3460 family protein [Rugosibacter sp.]|jgi:hypothetical protein|nr:DUF3460 family protein [Rugosibacter sp.]HQQ34797.1 DUF3460 family protein [Rugosibacter sp.]